MSEGTKTIDLAGAVARIEALEELVEALQVMAAEAFSSIAELEVQIASATQVAEAA